VNSRFKYYNLDASDIEKVSEVIGNHEIEFVYHLAANSDIQKGSKEPSIDFHNTFLTTYGIIEAMRRNGVENFFFASTSAIYGELCDTNLSEDLGGLRPISYYGGAKYASESFISSYSYMNDMKSLVFRFPNVIGPNLTHGAIFDFMKKLGNNSQELEILGDGTQSKPYIYVDDLVDAIIEFSKNIKPGVEIYNIGVEDSISVTEMADVVCSTMGLENVQYKYTGGDRGWKGDVPKFMFNLSKIKNAGYVIKNNSHDAVRKTVEAAIRR
jgi:UDP-glucose 4-epimerase